MKSYVSTPALPPEATTRENVDRTLCQMAVPLVWLVWL